MAFVTFDLFSALIDSRTGGAAALAGIGGGRGWRLGADAVYDDWDARNKASQKNTAEWVPFAEHCRRALADTYRALDLPGDVDADVARLLASLPDWPLWPDVRGRADRPPVPTTGWACCRTSTTPCSPGPGWRRSWTRRTC